MPPRFLDTNILLRYLTRDDEAKARQSLALLQRVERGEEQVETSTIVVFETVYILQRLYRVSRAQIGSLVGNIIQMPGVRLPGKNLCLTALGFYVDHNISFADAYHAVLMRSRGIAEIYSWDKDFDKLEGIVRVEPDNNG